MFWETPEEDLVKVSGAISNRIPGSISSEVSNDILGWECILKGYLEEFLEQFLLKSFEEIHQESSFYKNSEEKDESCKHFLWILIYSTNNFFRSSSRKSLLIIFFRKSIRVFNWKFSHGFLQKIYQGFIRRFYPRNCL